jgi:membrane protein
MSQTNTAETDRSHGRSAEQPTQLGGRGWKDIAKRVAAESKEDHLSLMSAGVAFYFLIALIPAIAALVSIYALVSDPTEVGDQLASFLEAAPEDVGQLVLSQAERVAATSSGAASLSAVVSVLLALWAASAGCQHLIEAVNAAYDEEETRGFVKLRGLALAMTVASVLFLAIAMGAIAVVPALLEDTALGDAATIAIQILRWPAVAIFVILGLAVLYRYAPDRDEPKWSWASPGAVIATVVWIVASIGFSIYVSNFGSYNETYGSLGAVIIVMLWLFITALSMILGAQINAEAERQTRKDTTAGSPAPMGKRSAYAADTLGAGADHASGEVRGTGTVSGSSSGSGSAATPGARPPVRRTLERVGGGPRRDRSSGHGPAEHGGWGAVAVSVAGRAVASMSKKRS